MTNQFTHEDISMLFCSEKFHGGGGGGGWVGDIAIIASSSRSRSLIRDLRLTLDLDPSLTKLAQCGLQCGLSWCPKLLLF